MDLRSQLLTGGVRPRTTATIGHGDRAVKVDVLALSNDARGEILNTCQTTTTNADGESETILDQAKLSVELVLRCAVHPGTETPVFSAGDREAIGGSAAGYFDPIITAASRLSGLGASAQDSALGNSGAIPGSTSASTSPGSSA